MINSNKINGRSLRDAKCLPSIADIPDSLPPFANANPPPNKKINDHGILALIYFHVIKLGVVAFGNLSGFDPRQNLKNFQSAGSMNNAITLCMFDMKIVNNLNVFKNNIRKVIKSRDKNVELC